MLGGGGLPVVLLGRPGYAQPAADPRREVEGRQEARGGLQQQSTEESRKVQLFLLLLIRRFFKCIFTKTK